jgi:hypothetical protein
MTEPRETMGIFIQQQQQKWKNSRQSRREAQENWKEKGFLRKRVIKLKNEYKWVLCVLVGSEGLAREVIDNVCIGIGLQYG